MNQDTIIAISTANGYAGIGVIKISGGNALDVLRKITSKNNFKPNVASYYNFYANDNTILDSGLALYFKAPRSFTSEDIVELHGHGSPVGMQMLLKRGLELGCRLANPGEFSQRAYLNNKIDLVQAESIIDLIHAQSEASAKSALRSLSGSFSRQITGINQQLIDLRMFVEATLDFPEEDIEFIANAKINTKLSTLQQEIKNLLKGTKQGVLLNNGANIVIIGRPNVGKSSLLNTLANEDIAIVTAIAGTTRDSVKQKVIIDGVVLNIIDTAGIRITTDVVENIGISRAYDAIKTADLCLILIDATIGITNEDLSILSQIPQNLPSLFIHNKIDLINNLDIVTQIPNNKTHILISTKTGVGINQLRSTILETIGFNSSAHDIFSARTRHLEAMKHSVAHIDLAFTNWNNLEILAEELRYAHNYLGEITGEFSSEQLLGEIFSRFCIGK